MFKKMILGLSLISSMTAMAANDAKVTLTAKKGWEAIVTHNLTKDFGTLDAKNASTATFTISVDGNSSTKLKMQTDGVLKHTPASGATAETIPFTLTSTGTTKDLSNLSSFNAASDLATVAKKGTFEFTATVQPTTVSAGEYKSTLTFTVEDAS